MKLDLAGPDRVLLVRYIESVLLRYNDSTYNLREATEDLAEAFAQASRGDPEFLEHVRGVVEAGDEA